MTQLKKILFTILRQLAQLILNKYQPEVIAITGSVGKTSTSEAVYTVLSAAFNTRKNLKNYNNELGIPLSIIGVEAPGRSVAKWLVIFVKAASLILFKQKNYPQILILEMGADHPGDINYLTNFVPIKIGIVTSVAPVHLEFFGSLQNIALEKSQLIKAIPRDGLAILNVDDKLVLEMDQQANCQVITCGLNHAAQFFATDISYNGTEPGISFKLNYRGQVFTVELPKVIAEHFIFSVLVAIAVGTAYEIDLLAILERLKDFMPPKGRMCLIDGIKKTLIIDDTYNSSPLAARQALYQLNRLPIKSGGKKWAVLGDMLELGSYSGRAHREIGAAAAEYKIDYLIGVGEISRDLTREAIAKGVDPDHCFNFATILEAGNFLQEKINSGDIILVKGSQSMRMEKIVKEIMAEPQRAGELLVRQDSLWV